MAVAMPDAQLASHDQQQQQQQPQKQSLADASQHAQSILTAASEASQSIASQFRPATAEKDDNLSYDLGNLTAYDHSTQQLPSAAATQRSQFEQALLDVSRDNVQLLMNQIFALPSAPMPGDVGRLAALPLPTTALPREKPLPSAKQLTKWEAFAKTKGIVNRKRSRMVFDEERQEYAPRHGYKRVGSAADEQTIIEHREGDDPSVDPWTKAKQDRKARSDKNAKQQAANVMRAAPGAHRVPGAIDLTSTPQFVNKLAASAAKGGNKRTEQPSKSHHVDLALRAVQQSTASMGKFDKKSVIEPRMQGANSNAGPSHSASETKQVDLKGEKASALKLLSKMLKGESEGGAQRESTVVRKDRAANQVQQSKERNAKSASASGSSKGGKGKPSSGKKRK